MAAVQYRTYELLASVCRNTSASVVLPRQVPDKVTDVPPEVGILLADEDTEVICGTSKDRSDVKVAESPAMLVPATVMDTRHLSAFPTPGLDMGHSSTVLLVDTVQMPVWYTCATSGEVAVYQYSTVMVGAT